jgi:hypothetical protein
MAKDEYFVYPENKCQTINHHHQFKLFWDGREKEKMCRDLLFKGPCAVLLKTFFKGDL